MGAMMVLLGCTLIAPIAKAERESIRSVNRPATRDIKVDRNSPPRRPANVDIDNRKSVNVDANRTVDIDVDNRRAVNVDVDVDHRHGTYWRRNDTVVIGAVVKTVPSTRVVVVVGGSSYFYADGIYYVQGPSGFVVVASPVGAVVATVPAGSVTIVSGSTSYFYFNGTYYIRRDNGFVVVSAPIGVRVTVLPSGCSRVVINGVVHYQHGGIYYRPSFQNGVTTYTTVRI